MVDPNGRWQVVCAREDFRKWRDSEAFHELLALARLVNSIRFTHHALLDVGKSDAPAAVRQRMNAFMYTGAVLFEGIQQSKRLGKHYREMTAFRQGFQPIHKDREVDALVRKYLKPLRNQVVFHSDATAVAENLTAMDESEYVFAGGEGHKAGYTYYELADATALRVIFGSRQDSDYVERVGALIQSVTRLAIRFLDAADLLITAVLHHDDWRVAQA